MRILLLPLIVLAIAGQLLAEDGRKENVHVQAAPSGNGALEWKMIGNRLVMTRAEDTIAPAKPAAPEAAPQVKAKEPEVVWYLRDGSLKQEVKEIKEKGSGPQMPGLDAPAPAPKSVRRVNFRNKAFKSEPVVPDKFEEKPVSEDRPRPMDFRP